MRVIAFASIALVFVATSALAQDAGPMPPQSDPEAALPAVSAAPISRESLPPSSSHAPTPNAAPLSEAPSSGVPALVTGGIFTGLGLVNLATSAVICQNDFQYDAPRRNLCTDIAVGLSGGTAGVGVILLIIGGAQRSNYNDWKRKNSVESHLEIAPRPMGATAGFKTSF